MPELTMPSLGADMDVGTVLEWRIRPGDTVQRGDIVALVQTDKADIEIESFDSGTVEEILVAEGVEVEVGVVLARLDDGTAPVTAAAEPAASLREAKTPAGVAGTPGGPPPTPDHGTAPPRPARPSPRARRLARERGVDLDRVTGTGPGGTPTGDDVLRLRPADRQAAQRHAVGALMARSKREIPHYYLSTEIDLTATLDLVAARNEGRTPRERLLPAAVLLLVVVRALSTVPGFNGHWDARDGFQPRDQVDLGVAVAARQGGLIAPTMSGADRLGLDELMTGLRDIVTRARNGRLLASELAGATATVTNLGERGARTVYGVIVPPQVALVGFGHIDTRPWVVDDHDSYRLEPRPVVTATLSGDHRATTGHEGSRLLDTIATLLRAPEDL